MSGDKSIPPSTEVAATVGRGSNSSSSTAAVGRGRSEDNDDDVLLCPRQQQKTIEAECRPVYLRQVQWPEARSNNFLGIQKSNNGRGYRYKLSIWQRI